MKFFCINKPGLNRDIAKLLRVACQRKGCEFVMIDPLLFSEDGSGSRDLVYRVVADRRATLIEQYLIRQGAVSFYRTRERALAGHKSMVSSALVHEAAGVAVPKTVYFVPRSRQKLREAVQYVGGFPLVVKVEGGSHGRGVIKVDSLESLTSLMDFLCEQGDIAIMRQFIHTAASARLIVLGDEVIDSIEYVVPPDDFRSNAGQKPTVRPKKFPHDVQELAVKSLQVLDLEFGGVDILTDRDGQHFVTEVNFPCNFARAQMLTGVDVAGTMIDYLKRKARG